MAISDINRMEKENVNGDNRWVFMVMDLVRMKGLVETSPKKHC